MSLQHGEHGLGYSGPAAGPVRVLVALDIKPEQARDLADLVGSIEARVWDEAGYLDPDGEPITPTAVCVAVVEFPADDPTYDLPALTPDGLRGVYNVGIEGLE